MPKRSDQIRAERREKKAADAAASAGPMRPSAHRPFAPPKMFPVDRIPVRPPLEEEEVIPPRVPSVGVERTYVPPALRKQLGPAAQLDLSEELGVAASKSGYHGADRLVRRVHERETAERAAEAKKPKPPPIGSLVLDDQLLHKAFSTFDLDKNEVVGAKELKHLFAQLGETVKDSEIDGMIQLCDIRGDGAVQFEGFLAIFSCPPESLRGVDVEALKAVVHGEEEEEEESEEESELSESSGSSLEPRR